MLACSPAMLEGTWVADCEDEDESLPLPGDMDAPACLQLGDSEHACSELCWGHVASDLLDGGDPDEALAGWKARWRDRCWAEALMLLMMSHSASRRCSSS